MAHVAVTTTLPARDCLWLKKNQCSQPKGGGSSSQPRPTPKTRSSRLLSRNRENDSCLGSSRNCSSVRRHRSWLEVSVISVPLSLSKGPSPFDCHQASSFPPPGATLCSDSTTLHILVLQFLCKGSDKRRASQHPPAVVPTSRANTFRIDEGSQGTHFFS